VFVYALQLRSEQKLLNLKLKTQPEQLLGSLPLAFALPVFVQTMVSRFSVDISISIFPNFKLLSSTF
jgi:hypothetical protein